MSTLDLTPIIQPLIAIAGIVITGLSAIYVPRAIAGFERRTGIQLTEQQRETIMGAVTTAAGVLETRLDQGVIRVEHINVNSGPVQDEAQKAINAVPQAMQALGMTPDGIARMIVARVDTAAHGVTTATSVATAPDEVVTTTTQGAVP